MVNLYAFFAIFAYFATFACSIFILYKIYKEEPSDAILALFCTPFYLYALIKHRHTVGPAIVVLVVCILASSVGIGMMENQKARIASEQQQSMQQAQLEDEVLEEETEAAPASPYTLYSSDLKGYDTHCAGCHDSGLAGAPKPKDTERWKTILSERTIAEVMLNAYKGRGGHPKQGGCEQCTPDGINNMAFYMMVESGVDLE